MVKKKCPWLSLLVLTIIVIGCLICALLMTGNPAYMDLDNYNTAPNREFLFGTDTMGRDIFSMIWYGGGLSLGIGFLATLLSTVIAVLVGSVSACASPRIDEGIMGVTDIFLSVPNLLLTVFLQAVVGGKNVLGLALVIGLTGWMSMAKVVRTEIKILRNTEYILAARCLGGGFFHILRKHLAPNLVASLMFMVVMQVRNAIVAESTLGFMGLGLPVEVITWGSMLSLSEKSMLVRSWWSILIPGAFLVVTLLCLTNLGNYLRRSVEKKHSNL